MNKGARGKEQGARSKGQGARASIHSLFTFADKNLLPAAADGRCDLLAAYIIYIMCVCFLTADAADGCGCAILHRELAGGEGRTLPPSVDGLSADDVCAVGQGEQCRCCRAAVAGFLHFPQPLVRLVGEGAAVAQQTPATELSPRTL